MSRRQGPHTWQERKKYSKEDAHAVKLGVVLALEPQSNNDKIGTQVETAATQPSNLILYTNMNKDKTTESVNEGEKRYKRLRAADIKRHGYTELAGRNDPKRAAVFNANTRRIARDRRLAGIVPGSANARPENRSDVLIHSARMSGEKRAAGKPSPRIPRKNRDRKIITNSFNHGLEEGHKRNYRLTHSRARARAPEVVDRADSAMFRRQEAQDNGVRNTRERLRRIRRNLTNSFNHGLDEAKRPAATKRIPPPKGLRDTIRDHRPSTLIGSAIHGATVRTMDHNLAPAGRGRFRHAVGGAVRGILGHVLSSVLNPKRK